MLEGGRKAALHFGRVSVISLAAGKCCVGESRLGMAFPSALSFSARPLMSLSVFRKLRCATRLEPAVPLPTSWFFIVAGPVSRSNPKSPVHGGS